jgi:hypothetical protein
LGKYRVEQPDQKLAAFENALLWLVKFYPDIEVERPAQHTDISSASRSPDAIALLWKATLLTEVRVELSAAQRRQNLEELVR